MGNFEIIFFWCVVGITVGLVEHEYSPHRNQLRMMFGYILINLVVWYLTVLDWMLIKYLSRRKK